MLHDRRVDVVWLPSRRAGRRVRTIKGTGHRYADIVRAHAAGAERTAA
ncbi:hypothetical protein [Streptomyces sp. AC550_RSS872]|nr:hypothetical protein [Streptomyces sp. AC550_RSS872]